MIIAGYLSAIVIGISLGLIGGGGSILTVPVLVYLFGVKATDATAFSLFIVGTTAAFGAMEQARRGNVDVKVALSFAIPSVAGVYLMRRILVPSLPETLFTVGGTEVTRDQAVLVLFGALMLAASFAMIRKGKDVSEVEGKSNPVRLAIQGFVTGLITGAVGAGGGFLIVPALVLVAKVPIKRAVGTSLMVIAINSLLGFTGDLQSGRAIAWSLVLSVAGLAVAGSFLGAYLGKFVPGAKLKPAFGYFVLVMGLFLIGNEIF